MAETAETFVIYQRSMSSDPLFSIAASSPQTVCSTGLYSTQPLTGNRHHRDNGSNVWDSTRTPSYPSGAALLGLRNLPAQACRLAYNHSPAHSARGTYATARHAAGGARCSATAPGVPHALLRELSVAEINVPRHSPSASSVHAISRGPSESHRRATFIVRSAEPQQRSAGAQGAWARAWHASIPTTASTEVRFPLQRSATARLAGPLEVESARFPCLSCGQRTRGPSLPSCADNEVDVCARCCRSGIIDFSNERTALKAIHRRVLAFFSEVLKLNFPENARPTHEHTAAASQTETTGRQQDPESRGDGPRPRRRPRQYTVDSTAGLRDVWPAVPEEAEDNVATGDDSSAMIPLELVSLQFFNDAAPAAALFHHSNVWQLGRCECRATLKRSTRQELSRWVEKIILVRGLAFEALGAILVHELMHAYMWLERAEGPSSHFDEAVCNLAAAAFLRTEAGYLAKARLRGDMRPQIHHREIVCRYRMLRLHELLGDPAYRSEYQKAHQQLSEVYNNDWKSFLNSYKKEPTEEYIVP